MKCASIHQTTRNLTIVLAGLLCVIVLTAQAVIAGQQEPRQKPKTDSNVDPLGILNTPEPPKPNPPAGQTPASNKPTQTSGQPTQRPAVMSSSLDSLFSPKSISVAIYHPVSRNFLQGGGRDWGTGVFQPSALFNLIDLNGGQLESGDFVNLVHQQTGQSLLITQGEKDRGLAL